MRCKVGAGATTLLALVGMVSACSSDNQSESEGSTTVSPSSVSTSPARPTLTDSTLQPPQQQNQFTTTGRPVVVFDPCTWVRDSAITKIGFDPKTRQRGNDIVAEYTFLTCQFDSNPPKLRSLEIDSGNTTFEEDQQKNGSWLQPTTINGRQAGYGRNPATRGSCEVHMRTKVGVAIVSTLLTLDGREQSFDACDNIQGIASAIEPEIGKGN